MRHPGQRRVRGQPDIADEPGCGRLSRCEIVKFDRLLGAPPGTQTTLAGPIRGRSTNKQRQLAFTTTACGSDAWEKYEWKKYSAVRSS
ncbi:UNVERIFIED_CONTAM: hypothetical protein FKN15_052878 [Acipenser sinensis]